MACRNYVARKEGCSNTWVNHFYPYIRDYGDPSNAVLTPDECWSIPNDVKCARSGHELSHAPLALASKTRPQHGTSSRAVRTASTEIEMCF